MNSSDKLDRAIYGLTKALLENTTEEENVEKKVPGGSLPGKATNIERNHMETDARMRRQYLSASPTYDVETF